MGNFDSRLPAFTTQRPPAPARAGLPGPLLHRAEGDLTAVLMHMASAGIISPTAAQLIALNRRIDATRNGAYYDHDARPRIVYHGVDLDAAMFSDMYACLDEAPAEAPETPEAPRAAPITRRLTAPHATPKATSKDFTSYPPLSQFDFGASTRPREWLHGEGPMDDIGWTFAGLWQAVQRRWSLVMAVLSPFLWLALPVFVALAALVGLIWLGALGLAVAFHWLFGLVMAS